MNPVLTQPSVLDALADELAARGKGSLRTKAGAASGTPAGPYLHGPNGLWSYPGLSKPVISTRVKPMGLAGAIPARPNMDMYPIYPYLTGFTNPAESQPDGVCDDYPTAGQMKNCFQFAQYGLYGYQTREMDLRRLGQIINRGEFTDLQLENNPLGLAPGAGSNGEQGLTWPGAASGNQSIINEAAARFSEVGVKFQNKLMKQFWYGNPVNNTAGGGYQEFPGLDYLIRTGIVDAVTGVSCPSLDSTIVNMNYKKVTDMTGNDTIINVVTYTWRLLRNLAMRTGLAPAEWAIVMRETLFYELSAIWPCNYLTYRCNVFNAGVGSEVVIDGGDAVALRDRMRQEQFLIIDGTQVNVIFDDAIDEETSGDTNLISSGCFASDMYIIPLSFQGNKAAIFWEYFDWGGPNAMLAASTVAQMPLLANFFWTDGGQYVWHFKTPVNYCVQWTGSIRPRLVLRTPHLAAKIGNVQYCPLMHPRDAFPDDPYYVNGGNTAMNTAPSFYNSWGTSPQA